MSGAKARNLLMLVSDFDYTLPPQLIAQYPLKERADSKMLVLSDDKQIDDAFNNFDKYIEPNDIVVFNNTKVIPARINGYKPTGGKVEILIERINSDYNCLARVRASKPLKIGGTINIDGISVEVTGRHGEFMTLAFPQNKPIYTVLKSAGHIPLPPYITRADEQKDHARYQTVYAKHQGAVAAPTAGLHFDQAMLDKIQKTGASIAEITLHVGSGTFQPIRVSDTDEHIMHSEWLEVRADVVAQINRCQQNGGRVIAVGTTTLRALESATLTNGQLAPFYGDSNLFITPGFEFKVVDILLTNFHLPQSTLLMLVSAFAGTAQIKTAYQHAIAEKYRFFSYGDAMLLFK